MMGFSFAPARLVTHILLHCERLNMGYDISTKLRKLALRAEPIQDVWLEGVSVTMVTALSAMTAILLSYLLLMAQGWL